MQHIGHVRHVGLQDSSLMQLLQLRRRQAAHTLFGHGRQWGRRERWVARKLDGGMVPMLLVGT